MLRGLPAPPGRSALRTVTAIASCKAGQHAADWPEKQHGLFAWLLAQGYTGAADANRDGRIEPTELFDYLQGAMAAAGRQLKVAQAPELFLPDNRPPRLSDDAKAAIHRLAAYLGEDKIDLKGAQKEYDAAAAAAGKEPEPKMLWGLVLLKDKHRDQALKRFDQLRLEQPDLLPPLMAIAWARFDRRTYQAGVDGLAAVVAAIPPPKKPGQPYTDALEQTFFWIGQLREFAAVAAEPPPLGPLLGGARRGSRPARPRRTALLRAGTDQVPPGRGRFRPADRRVPGPGRRGPAENRAPPAGPLRRFPLRPDGAGNPGRAGSIM